MPNYRETAVAGTQYQRCHQVLIHNPRVGLPHIEMFEEVVAKVGDDAYSRPAEGLRFAFDPAEAIPLLDLETGEATGGSMTQAEIHRAIYSLYIAKATARDAAQA